MNEWVVTAASAGVVVFMVVVAFVLGFRARARLDETAMAHLAAADGEVVEGAVIAANAAAGVARLQSGKLMVVRVMGADVSSRIVPRSAARLRFARGKLSVTFADVGYPPLHMRIAEAPAWVAGFAAGEAHGRG